jgi:hypothetical protein
LLSQLIFPSQGKRVIVVAEAELAEADFAATAKFNADFSSPDKWTGTLNFKINEKIGNQNDCMTNDMLRA